MKTQQGLTPQEDQQAHRVAYLISGFLRQSLTEEELNELDEWITASDENELLFGELTDPATIEAGVKQLKGIDTEKALEKIKEQLKTGKQISVSRKRNYWAYSIAASVLLIAGIFFFTRPVKKAGIVADTPSAVNDVQPGGNRATLLLADGSIVDLQQQQRGLVKNENGILINKTTDGQLTYSGEKTGNEAALYHTLVTPRGGQYKVTLPDGTIAWLNAASSLKYPVAFTGPERLVELKGEGYFEVAKNAKQPFKVNLRNETSVLVTGTHFNINAYSDETVIRTTLLEGAVTVSSQKLKTNLSPLQQAVVNSTGDITTEKNSNTAEATGWKDGKFIFKNADIETIMRQVARWYDIDLQYEGKINYHFNATIDRNVPVSKLLKLLEMTNNVHFTIDGKKIIVKP